MSRCLYFAYGSNLDLGQMAERCPGSTVEGYATLPDHRLVFRGPSVRRGSGVASVDPAPGHAVRGLLFEVGEACLQVLDRIEGHPGWYRREWKELDLEAGTQARVLLYRLPEWVELMAPGEGYLDQLRRAYHHHAFPVDALPLTASTSR